ncbi:hypothetical protein PIB30_081770 [Stylosanthes scabra]|uniref:Uncharacterized protein n=1 Tax=Stylosanthes scabra TaxID=79078 RepID=A0ABU6QSD2_9FABA|nr:hypothetical protein [Stylosanthes scabra]
MKQVSGFCSLLFLVAVAALAFFNFLSSNAGSSLFPDFPAANNYGYSRTTKHIALISRKLKENGMKNNHKVENGYMMNLDDYAADNIAVRTSPTEHGTPLRPYIPKPPSPDLPSPPDY